MVNPELEKQLRDLREKKKQMIHEFTRKTVDSINLSEQAALTHMTICDSGCDIGIKSTKKFKKKEKTATESNLQDNSEDQKA